MATLLFVLLFLPLMDAVMEQARGPNNVVSWKVGTYRNRNVIPMPPGLDLLEKKHKRRDVSENPDRMIKDKKSFIREHFSLPIGAAVPLGYSSRGQRKGKKSEIPLSEKLTDSPNSRYAPALPHTDSLGSRSKVTKTWGLTWEDPHPNPELFRDTSGSERSTLTAADGVKKNGKISEKEFDSGLMGRGLGGMTERAQNENLMEQKFADKIEDESDVDAEDARRTRPRVRIPTV